MAAHRLGQVEAYLTVREVLSEVSTASDDLLSRERSGFYQCRYATLGLRLRLGELLPQLPFVELTFQPADMINKQNAIQVINLMLQYHR